MDDKYSHEAACSYEAPLCPNCQRPMAFTRLIPGIGALPDLYSYYCEACGEAVTEAGEPGERRDLSSLLETARAVSLVLS